MLRLAFPASKRQQWRQESGETDIMSAVSVSRTSKQQVFGRFALEVAGEVSLRAAVYNTRKRVAKGKVSSPSLPSPRRQKSGETEIALRSPFPKQVSSKRRRKSGETGIISAVPVSRTEAARGGKVG